MGLHLNRDKRVLQIGRNDVGPFARPLAQVHTERRANQNRQPIGFDAITPIAAFYALKRVPWN